MKTAAATILAAIAFVVAAIFFNLAYALWIDPWLANLFPWSTI